MFLLRSTFWLGLVFLVVQPHGMDLTGSADRIGAAALETGRNVARDGLNQVACTTLECAGAKLMAQSVIGPPRPARESEMSAPYPAPPLAYRRT